MFTVTCQKNLGSLGQHFLFLLLAKPEIVIPGSGIRYFIFEISGKPSFVETVLWRVTQFFYLLCSQFRQKASGWINKTLLLIKQHITYPTVTSARSCNNVGHLFWFTILVQHETNDVILYIHSVHKHRGNTFQRQNYKMKLKQRSSNWINSMQVKKILFTNVFFSWSLCLLNMFPSMVFPKHLYFSGLLT